MTISRKQLRKIIINEMINPMAQQKVEGRIEFGYGSAGEDRMVYMIGVDGEFINGSISHRQTPLIAADAVAQTMEGSFDGDFQYLLENFGRVWAQMLKKQHGVSVSPQAMSSAVQSGNINFRRLPMPGNTRFSYGE